MSIIISVVCSDPKEFELAQKLHDDLEAHLKRPVWLLRQTYDYHTHDRDETAYNQKN